jgi:transcriptional regulator with XRE-family HTH domain
VADRMNMSHAAIAIIESGRVKPTTLVLERYAHATGHRLIIDLRPLRGRKKVMCSQTRPREH